MLKGVGGRAYPGVGHSDQDHNLIKWEQSAMWINVPWVALGMLKVKGFALVPKGNKRIDTSQVAHRIKLELLLSS